MTTRREVERRLYGLLLNEAERTVTKVERGGAVSARAELLAAHGLVMAARSIEPPPEPKPAPMHPRDNGFGVPLMLVENEEGDDA